MTVDRYDKVNERKIQLLVLTHTFLRTTLCFKKCGVEFLQ